jgi:hypothetical protein
MSVGVGRDDRESAVNSLPPDDGKAVSRLLDHCRMAGSDVKPLARDRLEAALGGELARRLVGALSGDHRLPARLLL